MRGNFSLLNGGIGKNVVIFIVIMSSSVHVDNKKDILILNKSSMQELYNTMLNTEAEYSINFTKQEKKSCLYLHYNGSNSCFF